MLDNHINWVLGKLIQKKKKKQLAPLDMKQKECTCITEVEENPNGKQ
jgi:hypothetical protein